MVRRISVRRWGRRFVSAKRECLTVRVPAEDGNVRGKRTVLEQRTRIDTVTGCLPRQSSAGLFGVISRMPENATHLLLPVAVSFIDPVTELSPVGS